MFTDDLKGEIKFGGKETNESHTGVMGEEIKLWKEFAQSILYQFMKLAL